MNQAEKAELLEQIEKWNDADEFARCIEAIEAIPEQERDYLLTLKLGRAYSNLAVLGDHGALGKNAEVDGDLLRHAIDLLESVRTQGENDPYWNARMGYSCLMAYSSAATAYEYAKRWLALAPDDPDAQKLVRDCEEYLEEGNSLELDWNEREEIIRRETIPPAADDILGHVKVHIDRHFGVYTQVLTDDSDPEHPLEIAVIPPRLEHDYYTLVTLGLSRHRMGFPEERREEKLERAELLINLPRDWKLTKADCREERWNWPIRMLLATARFAMEDPEVGLESRTTLSEGEEDVPLAEDTDLRGEILLCPGVFGEDSFFCRLPDGDEVNFYQVIPLYWEELQYKLEHGSDALLDLCPDESLEVINPHRLNVVTDREKISYDPAEMDNAAEQIKKIRALHLPVDELDACNRMAFFLGWAMKRGQMSNPFLSRHRAVVEAVRAGKRPDLRVFILDNLDGKLSTQFFDRRTASGTALRKKKRPTCFCHIPKKSVRVWSSCWMSGINSIWKRNLQMTPRSGWRGQRKENRLSFLTGTALCSATLPTASPRMGARCRLWTGCSPSARIWVGRAVGPSTPGTRAMYTAKVMITTSRTAASMISGTSAASTRTLSDF